MNTSLVGFKPKETVEKEGLDPKESGNSRVQDAALDLLSQIDFPGDYGLAKDRISNLSPRETSLVKKAASDTGIVKKESFPNVALALIQVSLMLEGIGGESLQKISRLIKTNLNQINLLENLNEQLPADFKDSYDITPEMRKCFDQLKAQGIDLLKGNSSKITRADDAKLRGLISSKISERRGLIEKDVREMGIDANRIERILKIVQKVMELDDRGKKKAIDYAISK